MLNNQKGLGGPERRSQAAKVTVRAKCQQPPIPTPSPAGSPGGGHGKRTIPPSPSPLSPSTAGLGGSCGGRGAQAEGLALPLTSPGHTAVAVGVGWEEGGRERRDRVGSVDRDPGRGAWYSWSSSPPAAFHLLKWKSPIIQLSSLKAREGD